MAILSEAYSHADFKTRVQVTHDFLIEILNYAALHADDIRRLEREADRQTALEGAGVAPRPALAVAYKLGARGVEPVQLEVMKAGSDSVRGRPRLEPTGEIRAFRIPVNDRFLDSLARPLPAGYFLPGAAGETATLLRLHGIQVQRLLGDWTDTVETLTGTQLKWAPREFQGHHLLEVSGTWTRAPRLVRPHGAAAGPSGVRAARTRGVRAGALGRVRSAARRRVRRALGDGVRVDRRGGVPGVAGSAGATRGAARAAVIRRARPPRRSPRACGARRDGPGGRDPSSARSGLEERRRASRPTG